MFAVVLTDSLTTDVKLRPYQTACLDAIHDREAQGVRRQIISLPTGTGKTIVFCSLIADRPDAQTLILVHRQELIAQTVAKLGLVGVDDVGVIQAGRNELEHRVLVASVQTLSRQNRLEQLPDNIPLMIIDECHHSVAETWHRIVEHTGCGEREDSLLLGFSATPERTNAKTESRHLAHVFDEIVFSYSIRDAILDGFLVPPRGIHVSLDIDLDSVPQIGDDFKAKALEDVMQRANAPTDIVTNYIEHGLGRCTVAFCSTVNAARELRDEFRNWGITSETLHGKLPADVRAELLDDHAAGKFEVLTSVGVLTEGVDVPAWNCAIFARPTTSRPLYIQAVGRVLRPHLGKVDALVLDCVGVSTKHKLITISELVEPEPEPEIEDSIELESEPSEDVAPDEFEDIDAPVVSRAVDLFADDDFEWIEIDDTSWAIGLGKEGLHIVVEHDGEYHLLRNGYPGPVVHIESSESPERLRARVESLVYSHNLEYMVKRGGDWRSRPVVQNRGVFARKWGLDPDSFMNDGALADAITKALGRSVVSRFLRKQALCRVVASSR